VEIIVGNYKISPAGDTCWQIQKRAGVKKGDVKHEWLRPQKYPTSLAHALRLVRELSRLEKGSGRPVDVDGAISELRSMDEKFEELIKGLEITPKDVG